MDIIFGRFCKQLFWSFCIWYFRMFFHEIKLVEDVGDFGSLFGNLTSGGKDIRIQHGQLQSLIDELVKGMPEQMRQTTLYVYEIQ